MLKNLVLLTLLCSCSGGLFSSGSDDEPAASGGTAGMNTAGSQSKGGSGATAPTGGSGGKGGSTVIGNEAGQGGGEPPQGSAGAAGGGEPGPDPTLSPELTNAELVPTTLDDGIVVADEQAAFTIATPSATYKLLRDGAMITSDYFGPEGSVAIETDQGLPAMTTVQDNELTSSQRARLISESFDGAWRLRWDFMLTHVTLRVENAAAPFSFTFRGAPGGTLETGDPSDRMVTATGAIYGTAATLDEDFLGYTSGGSHSSYWTGPVEWSYVYDTITKHSLFLVQHHDDAIAERYQVIGGSAVMAFSSQGADSVPKTFSFGIVNDNVHQLVEAGVDLAVAIDP